MRQTIRAFIFAIGCTVLFGCKERQRVGGGFVLVKSATMGPDHHPGTSLQRNGKMVWRLVFPDGRYVRQLCHDDMIVFAAKVPEGNNWGSVTQLFAVRGESTPVVLSERLMGQTLIVTSGGDGNRFEFGNITPTNSGIRIECEYWPGDNTEAMKTYDLSWPQIKSMLDEADKSAKIVHHQLGDYRVLPKLPPDRQNEAIHGTEVLRNSGNELNII